MNKSTFFTGQPIFAQLLRFIPRDMIRRITAEHNADRYCKRFTTYEHLVTMLYATFNHCNSLREVTTGMLAAEQRLNHLGYVTIPGAAPYQTLITGDKLMFLVPFIISFIKSMRDFYRTAEKKA
ncbi:MAG: DUF4372 domain-containing protein [Mucilaginibacter sp.]